MKVKLVKKENLMKAANRANLVKVAVQVNGRTGQYSSHRWKNPGAALNVLKETMKRAGVKTTDELEFKDRKSKKTLNEDELIKQYKESKTTDTLQDFVKKNYTVSKVKDEKVKEKKPKENTKKVTAAEEKPKQDKQADPNLEQAIETLKGRTDRKDITIDRENGRTYVSSPYDKKFINHVKKIGGKWDADRKQWHVRQDRENELRDVIAENYGWDERENEYVVVKYTTPTVASHNEANRLGNIAVATRRKSDEPVELSNNTIVLKGEFPESSPSNKVPMVDADFDMEFATILPKKVYDSFDAPLLRSMKVVWEGEIGEKRDVEEPPKVEGPWFEKIKLEGSEKQNKWAEDIRRDFYESYEKILESTKNVTPKDSAAERRLTNYVRDMLSNTSSRDWIDKRSKVSPEGILQGVYEITAMESFAHAREFDNLKDKLPDVIGMNDDTADLRTKIIERSLSDCYDKLTRLVRSPETQESNESARGFIESTLNALSNSDPDYWAGAVAFFFNIDMARAGEKSPIGSFSRQVKSFYKSKNELEPKLIQDIMGFSAEDAKEIRAEALKTRSGMAAKLLRAERLMDSKERLEAKGRGVDSNKYKEIDGLTRESLETARKIFETEVSVSFWYNNYEIGSIQGLLKEGVKKDDDDSMWISSEDLFPKRMRYLRRFGTKKIESKNEYAKANSYDDFNSKLSKLKDSHTDTVARAAMDMLGLDVPLYVKRNGKSLKLGRRELAGYCSILTDPKKDSPVLEIAVVDYPQSRQSSYKTTIHECMHGVFGNLKKSDGTNLSRMTSVFNEGMVEIMGQAATRKAYGKDYYDGFPSYLPFVTETTIRLKEMPEFKGKTVHEIGDILCEKMVAKDSEFMSNVVEHLESSRKKDRRLENANVDKYVENIDHVEKVVRERTEKNGQTYEKSEMGKLVEQIKAGLISLQGAMNSFQYREVATALLYRLLEEDEEAAETLSAFQ